MRFEYRRRTFLIDVLLLLVTGNALAEDRILELGIHDAASSAKPPVLSVRQNEQVVLRLTSDQPLHVHLHGYDIEGDVAPGLVTAFALYRHGDGPLPARSPLRTKTKALATCVYRSSSTIERTKSRPERSAADGARGDPASDGHRYGCSFARLLARTALARVTIFHFRCRSGSSGQAPLF
jgi:hypothetical protein